VIGTVAYIRTKGILDLNALRNDIV
jgi:hypothetical protein